MAKDIKANIMTQEEKNILIKELCMRIPYGVKCNINGELCKVTRVDVECQQVYLKKDDKHGGTYSIARGDVIKPYLRPMSSMTEEEFNEFFSLDSVLETVLEINRLRINGEFKAKLMLSQAFSERSRKEIDWLNAKHFDYRGLIPMGLALVAPENMYQDIVL